MNFLLVHSLSFHSLLHNLFGSFALSYCFVYRFSLSFVLYLVFFSLSLCFLHTHTRASTLSPLLLQLRCCQNRAFVAKQQNKPALEQRLDSTLDRPQSINCSLCLSVPLSLSRFFPSFFFFPRPSNYPETLTHTHPGTRWLLPPRPPRQPRAKSSRSVSQSTRYIIHSTQTLHTHKRTVSQSPHKGHIFFPIPTLSR